MRAQGAEIAQQAARSPSQAADAKPADDLPLRRVVAAALLDVLVRIGDPYPAALAAAKSLAPNAGCVEAARSIRGDGRAERRQTQRRIADAGAETVAGRAAEQCHDRLGHRRAPAGGRGQTGQDRTHRHRRHRSRRRGGADDGGGAAKRFQRSAARIEDAGAGRSRRRRNPGSTRPTRAMRRWPHPVNLRPTPWLCSPNRRNRDFDDPDHSVSVVDRAGSGRRGLGCRADRRCRAVVGRSNASRPRCRCSCWGSASSSSRR